jgi:hypothetical protein
MCSTKCAASSGDMCSPQAERSNRGDNLESCSVQNTHLKIMYEGVSQSFRSDQLFKVTETKQLCYLSIQSPFISTHTDTDTLTSP